MLILHSWAGPRVGPGLAAEFCREVLPIGAGVVLSALFFRIDVFLVQLWAGTESVALYNAVFRLVEALRVFPLGQGRPSGQFVAMVGPVDGLAAYDQLTFTTRASRPMRIAVQLRPSGRDNPPRWQRSVYLDESPRTVTVRFDDMHAVPRTVTGPAPLSTIGAIMFVVDTNNTAPGTSGELVVRTQRDSFSANSARSAFNVRELRKTGDRRRDR